MNADHSPFDYSSDPYRTSFGDANSADPSIPRSQDDATAKDSSPAERLPLERRASKDPVRLRKYYVGSGTCEKIVQSRDAEAAAIWATHQFLDENADLESIDWFDEAEMDNLDLIDALLKLGAEVSVSEQGFGRHEAGCFDTADVMTQWQHLMIALHRMDFE